MGYISAFIVVFIWSINIILARYFSDSVYPFQISMGRWIFALILILPFTIKSLIEKRHIIFNHWKYIVALGIFGIVFTNSLTYLAAETINSVKIGILKITFPLFLTGLSVIFLKIKLSWKQIAGILIAVLGVIVVLFKGDISKIFQMKLEIGDIYMLLNSLLFAIYSLLQVKRPKELTSTTLLSATIIVAVVFLIPICYFTEGFPKMNRENLELFAYLGLFNSLIAFSLWNYSLGKIGNIKTSMFYYLMPVISTILSYFVFKTGITMSEIIGTICIITGLIFLSLKKAIIKKSR